MRFRFNGGASVARAMGFESGDTVVFIDIVLTSRNCILLTSNPCLLLKSSLFESENEGRILETVLCSDVQDFAFAEFHRLADILLAAKGLAHGRTNRHRFWVATVRMRRWTSTDSR